MGKYFSNKVTSFKTTETKFFAIVNLNINISKLVYKAGKSLKDKNNATFIFTVDAEINEHILNGNIR